MLKLLFWASAGLLAYAHAGYPLLLWLLARGRGAGGGPEAPPRRDAAPEPPSVSLIVAAHDEEAVIAAKVANALALDYPRERLEVIVASDGSADGTVDAARAAGADQVLDLPRGGKVRAQDAAVERSRSEILAFSDANSFWAPDALRRLVAPFADPAVGYVCGRVDFTNDEGPNQEGLYWRYELALRVLESRLAGVTAGNGAIYATRRATYFVTEPPMSHDISFPFRAVKRGYRALYAPDARAEEKMVPSIEGEFARRRRMMRRGLGVVLLSGLLSPRGYPPLYALQVVSHRLLRVLTPLLHLLALGSNAGLARRGRVYAAAMAAQAAVLAAAALGPVVPARPARVAYYYVLAMAAYAAGIADWLRAGTPQSWEKAEGTR